MSSTRKLVISSLFVVASIFAYVSTIREYSIVPKQLGGEPWRVLISYLRSSSAIDCFSQVSEVCYHRSLSAVSEKSDCSFHLRSHTSFGEISLLGIGLKLAWANFRK